jgi:hypothetical protein
MDYVKSILGKRFGQKLSEKHKLYGEKGNFVIVSVMKITTTVDGNEKVHNDFVKYLQKSDIPGTMLECWGFYSLVNAQKNNIEIGAKALCIFADKGEKIFKKMRNCIINACAEFDIPGFLIKKWNEKEICLYNSKEDEFFLLNNLAYEKISDYFSMIYNKNFIFEEISFYPHSFMSAMGKKALEKNRVTLAVKRSQGLSLYDSSNIKGTKFWIYRNNVISLKDADYIDFIKNNPELFKFNINEIKRFFDNFEGGFRQEIISKVLNSEWIKVEYMPEKNSWVIEFNDIKRRKKDILNFLNGFYALNIMNNKSKIILSDKSCNGYTEINPQKKHGLKGFINKLSEESGRGLLPLIFNNSEFININFLY